MIRKFKSLVLSTIKLIVLISLIGFFSILSIESHEVYLYDYKGSSIVMLKSRGSGGTGFQITAPSGKEYILTNAHICRISNRLLAITQSGRREAVHVITIDKTHDLCIMTPVKGLTALSVASSSYVHQKIYLVGHPGLRSLSIENGRIAGETDITLIDTCPDGRGPNLRCYVSRPSHYINVIAYGGNSGSPVFNILGEVVGVLFAGSPSQNTSSYMVPLYYVHKFLADK